MKAQFTIPGAVPSLKNRKGYDGRNRRFFDNPEVEAYKRDFALLVPARYRSIALGSSKSFLRLRVGLFHPTWRRDADIAIVCDCLQLAGVISNDRWLRVIEVDARRIDVENPRAEITLEELMTAPG